MKKILRSTQYVNSAGKSGHQVVVEKVSHLHCEDTFQHDVVLKGIGSYQI